MLKVHRHCPAGILRRRKRVACKGAVRDLEPIAILVVSTLPVLPFQHDEACVGLGASTYYSQAAKLSRPQNIDFQALAADELQHLFTFCSLCLEPGNVLAWDHYVQ